MSALVNKAIDAAGLTPLVALRARGDVGTVAAWKDSLGAVDLLVLGALADLLRVREVGDVVRIYANVQADRALDVIDVSCADGSPGGVAALRRVAVARITGPLAARVRVDWGTVGLEVAQVALGFGASELMGPIANRRGLPIADTATLKVKGAGMASAQTMKKRELELLLAHAGRKALFVSPRSTSPATTELSHA